MKNPIVATLGFFDGVHIGHRYLISQVKKSAQELGLPSAVVTFPVHPRKVLNADYQPKLLCGFNEKMEQLASTEIDYCLSLPFTTQLSQLSANEFITCVLKERANLHTLIIGYDHRFGHNRLEGFEDYCKYGKALGMNVWQAKEFRLNDADVSSSMVRRLVIAGEIEKANRLLTYNYTLSGEIVEGFKIGRTIGFPTANIKAWEKYKVIPQLGVYAVLVHVSGFTKKGMLYIGTRPTFDNDNEVSVEVNIFDFEGDIYNQPITVEFIDKIRGEKTFENVQLLIQQLSIDKETVTERLINL